jgi:hypothetical protein
MLFLVGVLQVYSGAILMNSVLGIRRFFVMRNATDSINTGMLIRHILAFGIYMATTIVFYVSYAVYSFTADSDVMFRIISIVGSVFIYGMLVSQLLLANILWTLGTDDQLNESESSYVELQVQEFDADAEFQALCWNGLVRNAFGKQTDNEYQVSYASIVSSSN